MFGSHKRLEEHLRRNGRTALAEILQAEPTGQSVTHGPAEVVANTQLVWRVMLRVKPDGEESFDAEITHPWPQLDAPRAGQTVPVLFDPNDHSKVTLDQDESAEAQAVAAQVEARLSPQQGAVLGEFAGASVHDLMAEAMADPQGFAARMRERAAEARQAAMAAAAAAQAEAAQAAQAGAAIPVPAPATGGSGGSAGSAGSAGDLVDRLTRLADLHGRGELTDAEFEALKKKLLDE